MEQFVGGVTADQLTPIALEDVAVAVTPVGAEGTAEQLAVRVVLLDWFEADEVPSASAASSL